jgi:hypothetical protein
MRTEFVVAASWWKFYLSVDAQNHMILSSILTDKMSMTHP